MVTALADVPRLNVHAVDVRTNPPFCLTCFFLPVGTCCACCATLFSSTAVAGCCYCGRCCCEWVCVYVCCLLDLVTFIIIVCAFLCLLQRQFLTGFQHVKANESTKGEVLRVLAHHPRWLKQWEHVRHLAVVPTEAPVTQAARPNAMRNALGIHTVAELSKVLHRRLMLRFDAGLESAKSVSGASSRSPSSGRSEGSGKAYAKPASPQSPATPTTH